MVHQSCAYLKLKGSLITSRVGCLNASRNTSRLTVSKSVCILLSSHQPYVRLRCWQVNLKTIGTSSGDERLSTGSLGSLVTAVMTKNRLLVCRGRTAAVCSTRGAAVAQGRWVA